MAPEPEMSQEHQKLLMRKDTIHKGNWYGNEEKRSLSLHKLEQPPKDNKCILFGDLVGETFGDQTDLKMHAVPLEIRERIYRLFFVRPTGIIPTYVRLDKLTAYRNTTLTIDMYQWEHQRQRGCERREVPNHDGEPEYVEVVRRTKPDENQRALIKEANEHRQAQLEGGMDIDPLLQHREMRLPSWYIEDLDEKFTP